VDQRASIQAAAPDQEATALLRAAERRMANEVARTRVMRRVLEGQAGTALFAEEVQPIHLEVVLLDRLADGVLRLGLVLRSRKADLFPEADEPVFDADSKLDEPPPEPKADEVHHGEGEVAFSVEMLGAAEVSSPDSASAVAHQPRPWDLWTLGMAT